MKIETVEDMIAALQLYPPHMPLYVFNGYDEFDCIPYEAEKLIDPLVEVTHWGSDHFILIAPSEIRYESK